MSQPGVASTSLPRPASASRLGRGARPASATSSSRQEPVLPEIAEEAITRKVLERAVGHLSEEFKIHLDGAMEEIQKTVQDEAAVLLDSVEGSLQQKLRDAVREMQEASRSNLQELRDAIKVDAARSEAKAVQAVNAVEAQGVAWSAMSSENRRAFADISQKLSAMASGQAKPQGDDPLEQQGRQPQAAAGRAASGPGEPPASARQAPHDMVDWFPASARGAPTPASARS